MLQARSRNQLEQGAGALTRIETIKAALEDQMCGFSAAKFKESPDRVDALVWALTDSRMGGAQPPMRIL